MQINCYERENALANYYYIKEDIKEDIINDLSPSPSSSSSPLPPPINTRQSLNINTAFENLFKQRDNDTARIVYDTTEPNMFNDKGMCNIYNMTLVEAIQTDNKELIYELIESGIDVNEYDGGYPPIVLAIYKYKYKNINIIFSDKDTNIYHDVIRKLISAGANVNGTFGEYATHLSVLKLSIETNNISLVKDILNAGAVPNESNLYNCCTNNIEIIKLLIEYGLDLSQFGNSCHLLNTHNFEILQLLIKTSTEIQRKNSLFNYLNNYYFNTAVIELRIVKLLFNNHCLDEKLLYNVSNYKDDSDSIRKTFDYLLKNGVSPYGIHNNGHNYIKCSVYEYAKKKDKKWIIDSLSVYKVIQCIKKRNSPLYQQVFNKFCYSLIMIIDKFIGPDTSPGNRFLPEV